MEKIRRIGAFAAAALLGALAGVAGLIVFSAVRNQGRLPRMAPEVFYQAKRLWEQNGPGSYNVTVTVGGRQAAIYHTEVRDGEVQTASRNGQPLTQRRTIGTWSVPGMFATMQSDVDNLERHRRGTADRQTPQLLLRALFHQELGYPVKYHRTELRRWGANQEVSWEVTSFETIP